MDFDWYCKTKKDVINNAAETPAAGTCRDGNTATNKQIIFSSFLCPDPVPSGYRNQAKYTHKDEHPKT